MKSQYGQTLIEAVVALGIILVVITALVVTVIRSLNSNQLVKDQKTAQIYSEEVLEWIKSRKSKSWSEVYDKSRTGTGYTYCFDASPITDWPSTPIPCASSSLGGYFRREVVILRVGGGDPACTSIKVSATVSWTEGNRPHSSAQETCLTQWQR